MLAHRNILPFLGLYSDETGAPLFVLQYIERGDVRSYLKKRDVSSEVIWKIVSLRFFLTFVLKPVFSS